ncbi:MAG: hypothetical protein M0Q92_02835 [Methanoregula sp.]|nr:hypothetical protein [Methanoregula sp.]
MTIASLDDYIAAVKQKPVFYKSAARTTVAATPFTLFDLAGVPGPGTLSPGNTANGIVPTDATDGYPKIEAFTGTGYLTRVMYSNSVVGNLRLYDRLFVAGAYAHNADVTLSAQPSFAARVPNGFYNGIELWYEQVTAGTGVPSIQINYLDQDGNAGDTGVVSLAIAHTLGRCTRIPLASGDSGVSGITRVRGTVATAGTWNIMILRPLWNGRLTIINDLRVDDMLSTGMPQVYDNSALYVLDDSDATSSGTPYMAIEIADK